LSTATPPAIAPLIATGIQAASAIPALAGVLPASLSGPAIGTVLGPIAPAAIFLAPLVLPFLFAQLFQPSPETQAAGRFTEAAAVPIGTDLAIFGLPGETAPPPSLSRTEAGFLSFRRGPTPEDLSMSFALGAREALSFVPEVAARGEARIAKFLAAPVPEPAAPRGIGFFALGAFAANKGVPLSDAVKTFREGQIANILEERRKNVERARTEQIAVAINDPFFNIVSNAAVAGLLPGAVVSAAASRIAVGGSQRTLGDFVRAAQAAAPRQVSSVSVAPVQVAPPAIPATVAPLAPVVTEPQLARSPGLRAAPPTLTRAEFEQFLSPPFQARPGRPGGGATMANVSTSMPATGGGGFVGGLGAALSGLGAGLGNIISAATPLIPSILQATTGGAAPTQIFLPGGSAVGGGFPDPRLLQAQQAGVLGAIPRLLPGIAGGALAESLFDLIPGGGFGGGGGACITPVQRTSVSLPSRVDVPTVDARGNTRFTSFVNMGRPVLWAGDLRACKRVKKAGARARRAAGGR